MVYQQFIHDIFSEKDEHHVEEKKIKYELRNIVWFEFYTIAM